MSLELARGSGHLGCERREFCTAYTTVLFIWSATLLVPLSCSTLVFIHLGKTIDGMNKCTHVSFSLRCVITLASSSWVREDQSIDDHPWSLGVSPLRRMGYTPKLDHPCSFEVKLLA